MTVAGAWEVTALAGTDGDLSPVIEGTHLTLEITDGAVSGFGGCNRFFGRIDGDGGPEPMGRTMMAGPPDLMAQEDTYLALLERADRLVEVDGALEARQGESTLVRMTPIDREIRGVTWALTGIHDGKQGFSSVLGDVVITLLLDDDGRASGSSGCNSYVASYSLTVSGLDIGVPAGTRMMCPEPVMDQEARFLGWLPQVAAHKVSFGHQGRSLDLMGADGTRLLEFVEAG